jgi:hypothetical protein
LRPSALAVLSEPHDERGRKRHDHGDVNNPRSIVIRCAPPQAHTFLGGMTGWGDPDRDRSVPKGAAALARQIDGRGERPQQVRSSPGGVAAERAAARKRWRERQRSAERKGLPVGTGWVQIFLARNCPARAMIQVLDFN